MEGIKRCLYRRNIFLPATWATFRYNSNNSTRITNAWISADKSKVYASRSTSALMDNARRMASNNINKADRLVWLDMEMTGLNVDTCHIIEIAIMITDSDLEVISDDFNIIIHLPDEILNSMNAWCMEHHEKSGLIAASRASKISLKEAERLSYEFLAAHVPEKKCPIAGNTVWMDRVFLKKYMPIVDDYAHYRIVDVSTIKELARRWDPQQYKKAPVKEFNHRAIDDVRESIIELKYYKSKIFNFLPK